MIFLDTHVVVWLYSRLFEKISSTAEDLINRNDLLVSPAVRLELQYLYEIDRITILPDEILKTLSGEIGVRTKDIGFESLVGEAMELSWTRDPFDRLLVAQAEKEKKRFITRDERILANFDLARW